MTFSGDALKAVLMTAGITSGLIDGAMGVKSRPGDRQDCGAEPERYYGHRALRPIRPPARV
ncbi:hypothetical protein [Azonexus hydrophilus]